MQIDTIKKAIQILDNSGFVALTNVCRVCYEPKKERSVYKFKTGEYRTEWVCKCKEVKE
jgi:hypothetical protein